MKAEKTPKTITDPASLNILPPTLEHNPHYDVLRRRRPWNLQIRNRYGGPSPGPLGDMIINSKGS